MTGSRIRVTTAKPTDIPALFIQCKGLHSGRPLRKYMPNSFSIWTDDPLAYAKCYCLWKSRRYEIELKGSVIPFIRIKDARDILTEGFAALDLADNKHIKTVEVIDLALITKQKEITELQQLQVDLARSLVKW